MRELGPVRKVDHKVDDGQVSGEFRSTYFWKPNSGEYDELEPFTFDCIQSPGEDMITQVRIGSAGPALISGSVRAYRSELSEGGELDDVARFRQRPEMVGNVQDGSCLHKLVLGLVTGAVARSLARSSIRISVILRADLAATMWFTDTEELSESEVEALADARLGAARSVAESVLLEPEALRVHAGVLYNLCAVNALSEWMCDQTWSGTAIRAHSFKNGAYEGTALTPVVPDVVRFGRWGQSTTFLPSAEVFPSIHFDADRLRDSFDRLSQANGGVQIELADDRQ